ncbi:MULTISPECIES: cupin domain-containing protein [Bradyrhizobium]|uniref:Cupin domain-containing protein n=2 Tax=Bradyrhizobium quebecense TaxID=2748629 RepID=A0ABS3MG49_9BRAD|nr:MULTISPECIES: cupin domain-containing protein [Bradyrhizobium]UFX46472.1 cupin domain-containing protein [Bradyrhizobium sp. 41S5]UGY05712.1 cupin domain-containing protein [Bradyrhizobium quebecense]
MISEATSITPGNSGLGAISWNILGQTYVPKQFTDRCFAWHATLPPGTFVPPHIHPTQDEYLYLLQGPLDVLLDGIEVGTATGDLVRLLMGLPHGIFSKSPGVAKVVVWVSPSRRLFDLFRGLDNLTDPDAIVALSAQHEVDFLPPVA